MDGAGGLVTARRTGTGTVVRSLGVMPERGIVPVLRVADRYVALDRLRASADRIEWAPLRLGGEPRARPTSPRLPQALVLHLAAAARSASDDAAALATVSIPLELDVLASFLGTDADAVAGALGALQRAGVVHGVGHEAGRGADQRPEAVALAGELLGPAPRCAGLGWSRVALATAGSPSAWVAAHVLAERLAPDEWTPMPRSALEHTLGCGVSGVRSALERLATAGVVERREQRGGVSAYRFAPALFEHAGQGRGAPLGDPRLAPPDRSTPAPTARAVASPLVPPAMVMAADTGVRLTIGGVELDVPAGLRVRVDVGADGKPQISLVPVAAG